jgi:hypothetical protein
MLTIAVRAEDERFALSYDGKTLFTVTDMTFVEAGGIALWTKSDSVTRFDRVMITPLLQKMIRNHQKAWMTDVPGKPQRSNEVSLIFMLYLARGLRGFRDGFAIIILPAYMTSLGYNAIAVGIVAKA